MVVALKELSIRGDFRTTVEYLIKLLETESFQLNRIDTGWLDRLIAEKVQVCISPLAKQLWGLGFYRVVVWSVHVTRENLFDSNVNDAWSTWKKSRSQCNFSTVESSCLCYLVILWVLVLLPGVYLKRRIQGLKYFCPHLMLSLLQSYQLLYPSTKCWWEGFSFKSAVTPCFWIAGLF